MSVQPKNKSYSRARKIEMYIRDYEKEDKHYIEQLLIDIYKKDNDLFSYFAFNILKNSDYTIVAVENGITIGAGSIWSNQYHNNCTYMGINVLPAFREKGVGTEIFNALQNNKTKNKIQCFMRSSNTSGISFAKSLGFQLVRKTFEPVYDLSQNIVFNAKDKLPEKYRICSLDELNNSDTDKLINLFSEIYTRNHTFNKVSTLSSEQWKKVIYGSLAVQYKNSIIALSLMYYGEDKSTLELGVRGVKEEFCLKEKELLLNILCRQFEYVKNKGFLFIKDEIDDCDSGAMVVSEFYNLNRLVSWDTYLL